MKKTVRTTTGLIDALFDEVDNLIEGTTTPQTATAKVSIAKAIISTKRLEIEKARFVSEPREGKTTRISEVQLGS